MRTHDTSNPPDSHGCARKLVSDIEIYCTYSIRAQGAEDVTLHFFTPEGKPNLVRHRLNSRKQKAVVLRYKESILKHGIWIGIRGQPWAVPSAAGPFQMIAWGTLVEALYLAAEEDPENPQVKASIARGLPQTVLFKENTPDEVVSWLKALHNKEGGGSGKTVPEVLEEIRVIEAEWEVYKKKHGITSTGTGEAAYEKRWWSWLQQYHGGKYRSWRQFDSSKTVYHGMVRNSWWPDLKNLLEETVDFLCPRLDNAVLIEGFHTLLLTLNSFKPTTAHEDQALA